MEKWIRLLVSYGVAALVGLGGFGRGDYSHFDSGAFLPDSSLGI